MTTEQATGTAGDGIAEGETTMVYGIGTLPANSVIRYPSGRWGFVGSVDARLAFIGADGHEPTADELRRVALVGLGIVKSVKTRAWDTREEAIAAAEAIGLEVTSA